MAAIVEQLLTMRHTSTPSLSQSQSQTCNFSSRSPSLAFFLLSFPFSIVAACFWLIVTFHYSHGQPSEDTMESCSFSALQMMLNIALSPLPPHAPSLFHCCFSQYSRSHIRPRHILPSLFLEEALCFAKNLTINQQQHRARPRPTAGDRDIFLSQFAARVQKLNALFSYQC